MNDSRIFDSDIYLIHHVSINYADEEHKLGKERLSEMVERSLPSHIYILVSENEIR